MEVAVSVRNLSKNYSLSNSQWGRLRHLFAPGPVGADDGVWALRDVGFRVYRGEAFGIIGANGSGKSTLLQMIAGILRPTSGSIEIEGRLSALLELGSGFSPEFSGRDNVYLNASLLGLSREETEARFGDIERFAGIGAFIDQPARTYSTGMVLRLAFAVAAHVDPEILIVDEALAVGDIGFRQRCMRKIHNLRARGVTILFVSHETSDVKALCERCLWLEKGVVKALGETDDVVGQYLKETVLREIAHEAKRPKASPSGVSFETAFQGHRYGDGRARVLSGALLGASGDSVHVLRARERVTVRVGFRAESAVESPIIGFLLRNAKGESIFGSNTARENYPVPALAAGETGMVDFHWEAPDLAPADYAISLGIADGNIGEYKMCDYVEDAVVVKVEGDGSSARGYFRLRCAEINVYESPTG